MIRSAPSISTTGRGRPTRAGGSRAAGRPRGRRAAARRARARGPSRRRRWQSACRVPPPMGVVVRPVSSWRDLQEFIELPYRLHSNSAVLGAPAASRAPPVPDAAAERASSRTATRSCSSPGATGASSAASAPSTTTTSTRSTATAGACSASSSSRTSRRSCRRCSTPPRRGCAAHGRDRMIGPMDFTMNDECGVLIEGFERTPLIKQPWHPPYYPSAVEEARAGQGDGPAHVGARDRRTATKILPVDLQARRRRSSRATASRPAQDVAALAAQGHGPLRRGLQRGLERELGLRRRYSKQDLDATTPRSCSSSSTSNWAWSPRPPTARRRRRDHGARHQPGAGEDERAAAAVRLVALPAQGRNDRPRARRLPRRQAASTSTRAWRRRCTSSTSTPRRGDAAEVGRDGLDPRDQPNMNRAMEAMGGRIVRRFRVYERELVRAPLSPARHPLGFGHGPHRVPEGLPADVQVGPAGPLHPRPSVVPVADLPAGDRACCSRSASGRVGLLDRRSAYALGGYAFWTLDRVLDPPRRSSTSSPRTGSARACTGWSTASTTTTRTTRCGSSCRPRPRCRWRWSSTALFWLVLGADRRVRVRRRLPRRATWPTT